MDCGRSSFRQTSAPLSGGTLESAGVRRMWPVSSLRAAGRYWANESRQNNRETVQGVPRAIRPSRNLHACYYDGMALCFGDYSSAKVLVSVGTSSAESIADGRRAARFAAAILSAELAANNLPCPGHWVVACHSQSADKR